MANQGSVTNLKTNSIDQKVTTNGNGENTGVRVNGCLQDIVDTLTGSPVVSNGTPNTASVFASAAQGLAADSAVQPGDLSPVATSGNYNDLTTYLSTDGVTIIGDGSVGSPLTATFAFGFQGSYDPTVTNLYPTSANTIGAVPITAGMYWVVSAAGTINGTTPVNPGDGLFALVSNPADNDDNDWDDFPALYGGLPVLTVTGLDTDNTNPQNPVVQIATGAGLSGLGTSASPLAVSGAPVPAGNLVYVDAVNGNDGTGAAGDISTPFLTLAAAQGAASVGDTIMVLPGTYTSGQLGLNGVNWYFLPGATVNFSATGWRVASSLSAQAYSVYGFGVFNAASGPVVSLASSGSYYLEGVSFSGQAINGSNSANITIKANSINATNGSAFSGGTSTITCPTTVISASPLTVSSTANLTINGNVDGRISSSATLRVNGSVSGFFGSPLVVITGGSNVIAGNVSGTSTGRAIQHDAGNLTLLGSQISSNGTSSPIQKNGTTGLIRMRDCWIVANAAATEGITTSGTANVYCFNCHTNKPIGASVNIIGDMKFDSVAEATAGQVATVLADGTWDWATIATPSSNIPVGNTTFVDAVNGNDSTGIAGRLDKPFATLLAAQNATSSFATIVVYPGTYTSSSSLGKNLVNWYFMLGAIVNFTGTAAWRPNTNNVTFRVGGDGTFNCTGYLVQCTTGPTNMSIECLNASYTSIDMTTGTVNIKIKGLAQASAETAFFGDTLTFSAKRLQSSVATHVFTQFSNTINIVDTYFELTGVGGACRKNSFSGFFNMSNVYITGGAADSLFANIGGTFYCQNVVSNTGVSPLVVIDGNMQVLGGPATAGQVATANADGTWSWA